jgi:hypothetical protein
VEDFERSEKTLLQGLQLGRFLHSQGHKQSLLRQTEWNILQHGPPRIAVGTMRTAVRLRPGPEEDGARPDGEGGSDFKALRWGLGIALRQAVQSAGAVNMMRQAVRDFVDIWRLSRELPRGQGEIANCQ